MCLANIALFPPKSCQSCFNPTRQLPKHLNLTQNNINRIRSMQIIQNMFICLRAGNNPLNTVNTQTKKIFPPIHRTERQRSRGRHELMRTVSSDLTVREPSPPLLPRWQKPRQHKAPHEFDNDEIAFFPPLSRLGINIWLCREPEAEDVCGRLENGRACWLDTVVVNREKSWSARERNRDVKVNQSNDHRVHIIVGRLGDNLPGGRDSLIMGSSSTSSDHGA